MGQRAGVVEGGFNETTNGGNAVTLVGDQVEFTVSGDAVLDGNAGGGIVSMSATDATKIESLRAAFGLRPGNVSDIDILDAISKISTGDRSNAEVAVRSSTLWQAMIERGLATAANLATIIDLLLGK